VTLTALLLVALGIGLCIAGANASMANKLGDVPATRSSRMGAATGKFVTRTGMVLLGLGALMFVWGIVIGTLKFVFTLVFLAMVVVALFSLFGRLSGRSRAR